MKLKNNLKKYYFSEKIYIWEWILASLILLLVMVSYCYVDTRSLTIWSTNVWDVIFDGKPLEFWSYTAQNLHGVPHKIMANDLISILPLSFWNFPIWIAQRFFHYEINQNWILMNWSKLGLVAFLIATSYMGYKICLKLTNDKHRSIWAAYLTFSCSLCINGVAFAGQNDIFFIFFSVIGIYFLIDEKKWRFIIFSAISIAIKPFFIFVFFPLVLLVEKNILKIIANSLGAVSLYAINKVVFSIFPFYTESLSSGPSQRVLVNMFKIALPSSKIPFSMFLLGWLIICYLAYVTIPKDKQENNAFVIYVPTAIYLLQCCLSDIEHYRMLMVMPFLAIILMMNFNKFRLNAFMYAVFQFCACATNAIHSRYFLAPKYIKGTMFNFLFGTPDKKLQYKNIPSFLFKSNESIVTFIKYPVAAALLFSALLLVVINYPRYKRHSDLEQTGLFAKYDHGLLVLNTIVILPFVMLSFILFLK